MTTATPELNSRGDRVAGRFQLIRPLGRGAFGVVWLALDELLGRRVALKRVGYANPVGRAIEEARAAAAIRHRATVQVHDVISDDDAQIDWVVMEALPGRSLAEVLREEEPLSVVEANYVAQAVLDGLDAIHEAGLLHRDVKPGNIQLCEDGRVVLLDFGFAAPPMPADTVQIVGSLPYLAPELISGGSYSPASDLYAFGMTLYAALTARVPGTSTFAANDSGCLRTMPRLPGHLAPFDSIVSGLLEPDPCLRMTARHTRRLLTATRHLTHA